ncbi:hypothetical protein P4B35_02835 [Pontiellaceae bacterium B12227]|nr:hypothetical protein [Pontiellaceae bacterium B12227]
MKYNTAVGIVLALAASAIGEEKTEEQLAAAAQNPLASMISLPFQNNTTFGGDMGGGDYINVLNIQPVYPVTLSDDWNLITRTILPVVSQSINGKTKSGLSDTVFTGWFSPDAPVNNITWGVGPVLNLPTTTKTGLGPDQWGGGVSAVGVWIKGRWVAGALANNIWGFEKTGELNTFLFQYFINYNLDKGWYLVSGPIMTANWNAPSSDRWVVPVGGGVGKIMRWGKLPVNLNAHLYYNIEKPRGYGDYSARVQLQFMFPK